MHVPRMAGTLQKARWTKTMDTFTEEIDARPSVKKSFWLLVVALLLIWCCSILGPLSLVVVPVIMIGGLLYFLGHRRYATAVLLLVATPMSVSFIQGSVDYFNGEARLRHSGLPGTTFFNLDPELRCGRSTYGCIVSGGEWVTQLPYNSAVRLFTACFGWMPNTYKGPFPTEDEAKTALASGVAVSAGDLRNDRLVIDGVHIKLDNGVGAELLEGLRYTDNSFDNKPPEITAAIWQQDCILLRIPSWRDYSEEATSAVIALFSRAAGRPFAYYAEGSYSHRYPPVDWKRTKGSK